MRRGRLVIAEILIKFPNWVRIPISVFTQLYSTGKTITTKNLTKDPEADLKILKSCLTVSGEGYLNFPLEEGELIIPFVLLRQCAIFVEE